MAANSRFAVALHVMALLALNDQECLSSEKIAASVHTNPVVVRRILCSLCKAGLVNCQLGKCGGARLIRGAKTIKLLDIYRAVEGNGIFAQHAENPECAVSCQLSQALHKVFQQSERALESQLKRTTLAQLVQQMR